MIGTGRDTTGNMKSLQMLGWPVTAFALIILALARAESEPGTRNQVRPL